MLVFTYVKIFFFEIQLSLQVNLSNFDLEENEDASISLQYNIGGVSAGWSQRWMENWTKAIKRTMPKGLLLNFIMTKILFMLFKQLSRQLFYSRHFIPTYLKMIYIYIIYLKIFCFKTLFTYKKSVYPNFFEGSGLSRNSPMILTPIRKYIKLYSATILTPI